jgi:RimJ/RimL family protein N-acetyltransferase
MVPDDLQIGDTWTHPAHRNHGLAALAIRRIVARSRRPGRAFWYVVAPDNAASVRAIQKAEFALRGTGNKVRWPGIPRLGRYVLDG